MRSAARLLSSQEIFKGKVIHLKVEQVAEPGGVTARREVVYHSGSVVVLPRFTSGQVLLVRQFRYPARQALWELVAGGIDPGETPLKAAKRELLEETGYTASNFKPLLKFFPSPGFLTEEMHLIEARGLTRGKPQPESDEHIRAKVFGLRELKNMVKSNRIKDAKTLVALLWLLQKN
ncbi:MAG TPA: NUDIX hydrolase [Terriglobia bacterium]|nr:NUDIX hydrolase [Terriglobia bacterium]